jgi:PST family polysaccharide transporter
VPTDHGEQQGGLQRRVARGLTWTLIDTWGSQLLGLVIFTILANLLVPEDFGLVALAAVFVSLGNLFVDSGLGDAVIQRKSITRRQLDTAFWAALLTGALLTLVGIAAAPLLATLLRDVRLEPIIQVLSIIFVLVALSSIQMGILRREMDFRSLAIRKLLAIGIGGAVGVWMAFNNYGPWALVGQQVTMAAVTVVAMWAVSPWRPGFSFAREDFRSLFGFGINVVGADLLAFISRNTDNLLIGVFLGPTALGYYAVAYRILDTSSILLVAAARRLVFPAFARLQGHVERVKRAYARLTRATSAVTVPGYLGLALVSSEAIPLLFGDQWAPAVPAAILLFLIGPVTSIASFSGAVLTASGRPDKTFRFRLISTTTNVIGFLIAVLVFQNFVAVAAAYTIRGYLLLPVNMYFLKAYAHIPYRTQLEPMRGVLGATIIMVFAVISVKLLLTSVGVSTLVLLLAEVVTGVLTFTLGMWALERVLLRELFDLVLQVVPGAEAVARRAGVSVHSVHVTPKVTDDVAVAELLDDQAETT